MSDLLGGSVFAVLTATTCRMVNGAERATEAKVSRKLLWRWIIAYLVLLFVRRGAAMPMFRSEALHDA